MKIGIIVGSVREGRLGRQVGEWVLDHVGEHDDNGERGVEFSLVDLKEFNVPILTSATVPSTANKQYDHPAVTKWSEAIDGLDAYIFVTPEYNHGVPGAFKNAFDSLGLEWSGKAVGFVSYGADSGVRAVEQWRVITANMSMIAVRQQVSLSLFTEFGESGLTPEDRRTGELAELVNQVVSVGSKQQAA